MYTYLFKIYFDILSEASISKTGITVEPIEFNRVALTTKDRFSNTKLDQITTKLESFYNTKFHLTTANAVLDTIRQ